MYNNNFENDYITRFTFRCKKRIVYFNQQQQQQKCDFCLLYFLIVKLPLIIILVNVLNLDIFPQEIEILDSFFFYSIFVFLS